MATRRQTGNPLELSGSASSRGSSAAVGLHGLRRTYRSSVSGESSSRGLSASRGSVPLSGLASGSSAVRGSSASRGSVTRGSSVSGGSSAVRGYSTARGSVSRGSSVSGGLSAIRRTTVPTGVSRSREPLRTAVSEGSTLTNELVSNGLPAFRGASSSENVNPPGTVRSSSITNRSSAARGSSGAFGSYASGRSSALRVSSAANGSSIPISRRLLAASGSTTENLSSSARAVRGSFINSRSSVARGSSGAVGSNASGRLYAMRMSLAANSSSIPISRRLTVASGRSAARGSSASRTQVAIPQTASVGSSASRRQAAIGVSSVVSDSSIPVSRHLSLRRQPITGESPISGRTSAPFSVPDSVGLASEVSTAASGQPLTGESSTSGRTSVAFSSPDSVESLSEVSSAASGSSIPNPKSLSAARKQSVSEKSPISRRTSVPFPAPMSVESSVSGGQSASEVFSATSGSSTSTPRNGSIARGQSLPGEYPSTTTSVAIPEPVSVASLALEVASAASGSICTNVSTARRQTAAGESSASRATLVATSASVSRGSPASGEPSFPRRSFAANGEPAREPVSSDELSSSGGSSTEFANELNRALRSFAQRRSNVTEHIRSSSSSSSRATTVSTERLRRFSPITGLLSPEQTGFRARSPRLPESVFSPLLGARPSSPPLFYSRRATHQAPRYFSPLKTELQDRMSFVGSHSIKHLYQHRDVVEECPVCLDVFLPEEEIRRLPCLHMFHLNCVDQWLLSGNRQADRCPVCMTPLDHGQTDVDHEAMYFYYRISVS